MNFTPKQRSQTIGVHVGLSDPFGPRLLLARLPLSLSLPVRVRRSSSSSSFSCSCSVQKHGARDRQSPLLRRSYHKCVSWERPPSGQCKSTASPAMNAKPHRHGVAGELKAPRRGGRDEEYKWKGHSKRGVPCHAMAMAGSPTEMAQCHGLGRGAGMTTTRMR